MDENPYKSPEKESDVRSAGWKIPAYVIGASAGTALWTLALVCGIFVPIKEVSHICASLIAFVKPGYFANHEPPEPPDAERYYLGFVLSFVVYLSIGAIAGLIWMFVCAMTSEEQRRPKPPTSGCG